MGQKSGEKIHFNKTQSTLEEDLDSYETKVDTDNWENKRGPRPWEPGSIEERQARRFAHSAPTVQELTQQS